MTGSHQHLRSYAARTLHHGVGYADAILPHTRAIQDHGVGTRAFCSTRRVSAVVPESVCALIVYLYVHAA